MTETTTVETKLAGADQTTVVPSTTTEIDAEATIARLEAEKAKIAQERDNYRVGMLKAKGKIPESVIENDEEIEDKMKRIAMEAMSESRLAEIAHEQDEIIKIALRENKELKLALKNNPSGKPLSTGTDSTLVSTNSGILSKEQIDLLKAKGWSDKKIELLKTNIRKNSR